MFWCGNNSTETFFRTDQKRPGGSKGGAPRSESKIAMIAGGNHTTIPRRGLLRCPISSSALKSLRQLSTAATRSARLLCHWQRSLHSPLAGFFRVFLAGTRKTPAGGNYCSPAENRKKESQKTIPFDHVVFINFSRHLGQVMEIFPFPLGTLTCWRHRGQL